jgi:hypothetical protein
MESSYNQHRRAAPAIILGDRVLLDREGIQWAPDAERSKKLLLPFLGPFKVLDVDNLRQNYTLDLPPHMKCHRIFHVSKLKRYEEPDRYFDGRPSTKPVAPAYNFEGHDEYKVDRILDSRLYGRWKKRQFLIKWKDASEAENSWEPEEFLEGCPEKITAYLESLRNDRPFLLTPQQSRGSVLKATKTVRKSPRLSYITLEDDSEELDAMLMDLGEWEERL